MRLLPGLLGSCPWKSIHSITRISMSRYGSRSWQPWEDDLVRKWIETNGKTWTEMSAHCLPHRTPSSCYQRWSDFLDPTIVRGPFTPNEVNLLRKGAQELGAGNWRSISDAYLPHRPPRKLADQWMTMANPALVKGRQRWTKEEDELLLKGLESHGRNWTSISRECIPWRSRAQIAQRYRYSLDPQLAKKSWSKAETDVLLRRAILYENEWTRVADGLPGRTPKQCEEAWSQYMHPDGFNLDTWSAKETLLFWHLTKSHGDNWNKIADMLPNQNRFACSAKFCDAVRTLIPILFGKEFAQQHPDENTVAWRKRLAAAMVTWLQDEPKITVKHDELVVTKTGPWTEKEKQTLMRLANPTENDWDTIAKQISGRTAKQCSEQYKVLCSGPTRRQRWKENEVQNLIHLVDELGTDDWTSIASLMAPRTAKQCRRYWKENLLHDEQGVSPTAKNKRMSEAEGELIRQGVERYNRDWGAISRTFIPHRTPEQCRRWYDRHCDHSSGPWTSTEDEALRYAVQQFSANDIPWDRVAGMVPHRAPGACRDRWRYALCNNVRRGAWGHDEIIHLVEAVQHTRQTRPTLASDAFWSAVAAQLDNGRTNRSCRTKFEHMRQTNHRLARFTTTQQET